MTKSELASELLLEADSVRVVSAKFAILCVALEVLVPGRYSQAIAVQFVKQTIRRTGERDAKAVGSSLNRLLVARHTMTHDGATVAESQVIELRAIIERVLNAIK